MIVRKYGRRGRGLTSSYSGSDSFSDVVVSDSPSQECPQDVYNYAFSSQDSAGCNWSDPYSFSSSQELSEVKVLPPRKSGQCENFDDGFWKAKKLKVIDVDSEPYGCSLSQESKNFGFLAISDDGFEKSKKVKKVDLDPFEYRSSEELEDVSVLPPREARKSGSVFDFNENDSMRTSNKFKNVDSDSYGLNSSQESDELGVSQPRKSNRWAVNGVSLKSKKELPPRQPRRSDSIFEFSENDDIGTSNKFKNVESDCYLINSSQESDELGVSQPRKSNSWTVNGVSSKSKTKELPPRQAGRSGSVFEFSENDDIGTSNKFKNVDSDCYMLNSSQESGELGVSQPRKSNSWTVNGVSLKSKKKELPPGQAGRSDSVFEFSENDDIGTSNKFKNVDSDSYGLNSSQESGELGVSQPRKSNSWAVNGGFLKSKKKDRREHGVLQKKKKKIKNKMKPEELISGNAVITTTLMETQEFGEMMEHVDEVNFALDGLKSGQPVRIRRGSLLSLLSICRTAQQRRLLRVHGMAKTIIDAVLALSFDDPTSNLAAAALFYILTSDGQEDHLLDSPNCIRFLIKLLKPLSSSVSNEKVSSIGSKLLGICKNPGSTQDSAKGTDSTSTAISDKVQEILVNCKEIKLRDDCDNREEPEMNPKWISLLTMEKACMSTISIEDISGTVRKSGGNFKEKLRELGGLDAVFEVARKCHSTIEEWLQKSPTFALDLKDSTGLESLVVVLKCLRIMENATFLSKDNQGHLLGMKGNFDHQQAPRSFVKLILSVIKILSGVSLLISSQDKKSGGTSNGSNYSGGSCSVQCTSQKNLDECNKCLTSSQTGSLKSFLEPSQVSTDPLSLKMRVESSTSGSCSGTFKDSDSRIHISNNSSQSDFVGKKQRMSTNIGATEDSQDPFAFDDDEFAPSNWDVLSGNMKKSASQDNRATMREINDMNHSVMVLSQQESCNMDNYPSDEGPCSSTIDEEKSSLLADCLLTAVKVLMNLTNDNPEGCRQIATCGGLEILSSLLARHFPSFSRSLPHYLDVIESSMLPESGPSTRKQSKRLTDQELDFLVAILGLLVNLVEKDGRNRSWLAATSVSVPIMEGFDLEDERGVIPLLCAIFVANHGAGEAAADGKDLSWDEETILQGEKEAEKMIIEAYSALLLAFLSTESRSIRDAIADCLPKQNLTILVPVLERFVEFHTTLNMIPPETHKIVLEVIESCRIP